MKRPSLALALAATAACQAPSTASEPRPSSEPCARLPLVGALAGRTPESFAKNGRPIADQRFTLATGLDPSRRTLLNVLQRPRDDAAPLRELTWTGGGCRLTVWFRQTSNGWRSIHAVRTSADAEH